MAVSYVISCVFTYKLYGQTRMHCAIDSFHFLQLIYRECADKKLKPVEASAPDMSDVI